MASSTLRPTRFNGSVTPISVPMTDTDAPTKEPQELTDEALTP